MPRPFKPPQSPNDPIRLLYQKVHISKGERGRVVTPKRLKLDWRAYFYNFCLVHKEPVEYKNQLIFRDGWSYSVSSYEGPEYPPPADHFDLDILVTNYWLIRLGQTRRMLDKKITERETIVNAISSHSLDLQQMAFVARGEKREKCSLPLNLHPLNELIRWLRVDLIECEQMLQEIENFHRKRRDSIDSINLTKKVI